MKNQRSCQALQSGGVVVAVVVLTAIGSRASAEGYSGASSVQLCALGAAAVGQPGMVICKDVTTGATTQSAAVGATFAAAGGIAGSLVRHGARVLVTNQAEGAVLFELAAGRLQSPVMLATDGEGTLSGALGDRGAYVLTGTRLLFFPRGETTAAGSQPLLVGDGSAAQVVLAGNAAYVSEKSGSLEVFALRRDGNFRGGGAPVAGIPAGTIVGIAGAADLVVAPIAHLASNFDQSSIPVVRGLAVTQTVPTKEVAACWAASDDGEVCVTNPGSMTVSCGRIGPYGFASYTSAATSLTGETVFDIDMMDRWVGVLGRRNGVPVLLTYTRSRPSGDFLQSVGEQAFDTATASGAMLLPSL